MGLSVESTIRFLINHLWLRWFGLDIAVLFIGRIVDEHILIIKFQKVISFFSSEIKL